MRIKQIIENSTTAGSISTLAMPMTTQTRESVNVPGLKPASQVMTRKAKKKGPYANSLIEGTVNEEEKLDEDDIILNPRLGRLRKSGFMSNDRDSEGETFKNSLHTIVRVATHLDKELSTHDEFPEWMSEKIGAVKSMMVSIMNYVISAQEMERDPDAMSEGIDPFVAGKLNKLKDLNPVDRASAYGGIRSWLKDNPELAGQASKLASAYAMADVARQQYKTAQAKQMLADLEPQHQAFIKQALGQEQGVAEDTYNDDVKRAFPGGKSTGVKTHSNKPAVVKTDKPIGTRVSDIDPWSGKEYNVKTDQAWDNENRKK